MAREPYSLGVGVKAADIYNAHTGGERVGVLDIGREMAHLTIPSVLPPEDYKTGDKLPGNNQSLGARLVSNLANNLMFMAFPPGQPIVRFEAIEYEVQDEIAAKPELWSEMLVALSRLEQIHRKRLMTTPIQDTYVNYMKLLLVAGNGLWKHMRLATPAFYKPDTYIVVRDNTFQPLLVIHEEKVRLETLSPSVVAFLKSNTEKWAEVSAKWSSGQQDWDKEVTIYSVQRLEVSDNGDREWAFWQDWEGILIEGSEVTTDYDTPPMWPGALIPVFGSNWGRSYCEEYRGDFFTLEANSSSVNDLSALMSLALTFVKPGSPTSIRQVRTAKNLSVLPGQADDVTVFRAEKGGDGSFVLNHLEAVAQRLSAAFLLQQSIQRNGERVTKEEIVRLGGELDKAMGGLYTQNAQGNQKIIFKRAFALHEAENPKLPRMPEGVLEVQVVTGIDALGNTTDYQNLIEWAETGSTFYKDTFETHTDGGDFLTRIAAAKGIKPEGLILSKEQIAEKQQAGQQQNMMQSLLDKGTGPAIKGLADAYTKGQQGAPPAQQETAAQ